MYPVVQQPTWGARGWSPTPYQSPALRPRLGQTVVTAPTTVPMPGMAPKPPFIDSALVAFIFDGLGATAYGILSYGAASVQAHTWSKIFGIMAGLLALKGLYDLSNVRTK